MDGIPLDIEDSSFGLQIFFHAVSLLFLKSLLCSADDIILQ